MCRGWLSNRCKVFESGGGNCIVCNCSYSEHEHSSANYRYIYKDTTIKNEILRSKSMMLQINEEKAAINHDVVKYIHDANNCLQRLREIALLKPCPGNITDAEYINNLLIQNESQGPTEKRMEYLQQIQRDIEFDQAHLHGSVIRIYYEYI